MLDLKKAFKNIVESEEFKKNQDDILEELTEQQNIDWTTVLNALVTLKNLKYMGEKDSKIDLNKINIIEESALSIASSSWFLNIVKLLVEKWADINIKTSSWYTPLMSSCVNWQTEIAEFLIESWASINIKTVINHNGTGEGTALFFATRGWYIDIVKLLLKKGAYIDNINELWLTPLMMASVNHDIDIIEILIKSGADKGIENIYGEHALDMARNCWCSNEILNLLKQ